MAPSSCQAASQATNFKKRITQHANQMKCGNLVLPYQFRIVAASGEGEPKGLELQNVDSICRCANGRFDYENRQERESQMP